MDFPQQINVRKRTKGLARVSFVNEVIDAIANTGPVPHIGNRHAEAPWPVMEYMTFRVKLVQSGGSNGSNTAAPTYTYHVYHVRDAGNAKKLNLANSGAALSPEKASPIGLVTAATIGLAYYDADGALKLYEAYEKPDVAQGCT